MTTTTAQDPDAELSTVDFSLVAMLVVTGLVTLVVALVIAFAAAFLQSVLVPPDLVLFALPPFAYTAIAWFAAYRIRRYYSLALVLSCSLPCFGIGYAFWWPLTLVGAAMVFLAGIQVWRRNR